MKTSRFVCVVVKISQKMIITMVTSVVDQTPALTLRVGQYVPEEEHARVATTGHVEIYRYPHTRPATVEQNDLHGMIGGMGMPNC